MQINTSNNMGKVGEGGRQGGGQEPSTCSTHQSPVEGRAGKVGTGQGGSNPDSMGEEGAQEAKTLLGGR